MFEHEFAHHARLGTGPRILGQARPEPRGARRVIVRYRRDELPR